MLVDLCRSSGHLSAPKAFGLKNTGLLRVMPPSQLFKISSPRLASRFVYTLGRVIDVHQQHHLYNELSFDFETPLKLKLAMMITGGSPLLAKFLQVILIALPNSTEQSTLAQSPIHFPTELPSVLQA